MQIDHIVQFWSGEQSVDDEGRWTHRLDRNLLNAKPNTFNLDYPVSPYVGDIVNAPVIILGANGGYSPSLTPSEFSDDAAVKAYVERVDDPSDADWSFTSRYYDDTNYGHLVACGKAALINACAYRSPKISEEKENRTLIRKLPSCVMTRRWLIEAVLPLANAGEQLIVVNRGGLWELPASMRQQVGVAFDPAPVSPRITSTALVAMNEFLAGR